MLTDTILLASLSEVPHIHVVIVVLLDHIILISIENIHYKHIYSMVYSL